MIIMQLNELIQDLSMLIRKPSGISPEALNECNWDQMKNDILEHINKDQKLLDLLNDLRLVFHELKYQQSINDFNVYYETKVSNDLHYVYARTYFWVNGERWEFQKNMGRKDKFDESKINLEILKKYFLFKLEEKKKLSTFVTQ